MFGPKMMMRTSLCCLILQLFVLTGYAQFDALMLRKLDSIALQDVPARAPGIVTGIVQHGKVSYQRFGGIANLADSTAIGPDTRFNIASNGKQFTALAVLLLVHQGRVRLDADLHSLLPTSLPLVRDRITVLDLLTHRSGIRDVYDLLGVQGITWWKQNLDNQDIDSILRQQRELNQPPGTLYQYSNSNYLLLANIVSRVSGKSFRTFTDSMFQALGMGATAFEDHHESIREPFARPYFNFDTWQGYDWVWDAVGDGNLFTSLRDMLQWEVLVQDPARTAFPAPVIRQSQELPQGATVYGYGLEFGTYRAQPYRFHEGATGAWKATLVRFPGKQLSIITATNSGKTIPSMQTRQLADLFLPVLKQSAPVRPIPGAFLSTEVLEGVYQQADGFYFHFQRRGEDFYLLREGRNDVRLIRSAGNIFCQANDTVFRQAFQQRPDGSIEVAAYHWSHDPYTLVKPAIATWNLPSGQLEGEYLNTETGVRLKIDSIQGRSARYILRGDTLTAVFARPDRLLGGGYQIDWKVPDGHKPVQELFLQFNRVRNLRFTRVR